MARSIYCSTCKKEKEDSLKHTSTCKSCRSVKQKESRIKKRLEKGLPPTREIRKAYCNICIEKQNNGEDIRGKCAPCNAIAQHARVVDKRISEGKPAESTRNSPDCVKCGVAKINGRCLPCNNKVKAANKAEKRKKLREESGKRPWGSGRPDTCYTCGKLKERPASSTCNACASEYHKKYWKEVKAPQMNKREVTFYCECGNKKESSRKVFCNSCLIKRERERGLLASRALRASPGYVAPARSIHCSTCKSIKENQKAGYCNACERERYLLKQKPDCSSCGNVKENTRDAYCNECKRNKLRVISALKGKLPHNMQEVIKRTTCPLCLVGANNSECLSCDILRNEERKFRAAVRRLTRNKIKQGVITRAPCEVCGTEEDVHAHHDDYYKALDIRWLCRHHHREYHYNNPI